MRIALAVASAGVLGLVGFLLAGTNAQGAVHQSASSATVSLRTTKLGAILVNSKGHTLYLFAKDKNGKSACSGNVREVLAARDRAGEADRRRRREDSRCSERRCAVMGASR